ncbi:MAG: mannitol dehydrogenase family protein [Stappiaceae bacterium]
MATVSRSLRDPNRSDPRNGTHPSPVMLRQSNLGEISARIGQPTYDRSQLTPGILHIGVGNFHRAHQAVYLDRLFRQGEDMDWAIIGAGVRPADTKMRNALQGQDWLTSVVELAPDGNNVLLSGAMIDFVEIDTDKLLNALNDPAVRIVSLTITEGGYFMDEAIGGFDKTHPEVRYDGENPEAPKTVFGLMLAALKSRKEQGIPPFTIMSCDNIPGNGHAASAAMIGLAELSDPAFAGWVMEHVAFPNSMVDCITPATSDRERRLLVDQFHIEDAWPVFCEPYRQWVLEDKFSDGRPALEKVGVQFVDDVSSFELMKLRILNGGHAAIAYPSVLLDIEYVHDAMSDPLIRNFLDRLELEEIMPIVPAVPGTDFANYYELICERFSNAGVADTTARLCQDGSNRQPKFILPSVQAQLDQKGPMAGLALVPALWCRYCAGFSESGKPIVVEDIQADRLQALALEARGNPQAFLSMEDVFGELAFNSRFSLAFSEALNNIWQNGVSATLAHYGNGPITDTQL